MEGASEAMGGAKGQATGGTFTMITSRNCCCDGVRSPSGAISKGVSYLIVADGCGKSVHVTVPIHVRLVWE